MTLFRPVNLDTDAADLARLFSYSASEPITAETIRDWWAPRKDEVHVTTLALEEGGQAIGYWDVAREAWMRPGH